MPIIKTEILGSQIEINFQVNERERLKKIILNFKKRLDEFPNDGRISNNKIMFLAALKAEDQLEEVKNLLSKNNLVKKKIDEQTKTIKKLNNDIIHLKDDFNKLNSSYIFEKKNNSLVIEEILKLRNMLLLMQKKISDTI